MHAPASATGGATDCDHFPSQFDMDWIGLSRVESTQIHRLRSRHGPPRGTAPQGPEPLHPREPVAGAVWPGRDPRDGKAFIECPPVEAPPADPLTIISVVLSLDSILRFASIKPLLLILVFFLFRRDATTLHAVIGHIRLYTFTVPI